MKCPPSNSRCRKAGGLFCYEVLSKMIGFINVKDDLSERGIMVPSIINLVIPNDFT
jgi:hypothetical protein